MRPEKRLICGVKGTGPALLHGPPRWGKMHLTYFMDGRDTGDMDKEEWDDAWVRAFASWSNVCGITFEHTHNNKTCDILIDVSRKRSEGFGKRGKILAWAQLPSVPDWRWQLVTKFDKAEEWVIEIEDPNRDVLLQNVAAHEIGHLLGLDHSFYDSALMGPYYNPNIVIPQLIDDVLRIQDLYSI
jgi:predicted Zn-dependent protease